MNYRAKNLEKARQARKRKIDDVDPPKNDVNKDPIENDNMRVDESDTAFAEEEAAYYKKLTDTLRHELHQKNEYARNSTKAVTRKEARTPEPSISTRIFGTLRDVSISMCVYLAATTILGMANTNSSLGMAFGTAPPPSQKTGSVESVYY